MAACYGENGTDKGAVSRLEDPDNPKRITDQWIFAYAEALDMHPSRFLYPPPTTIDLTAIRVEDDEEFSLDEAVGAQSLPPELRRQIAAVASTMVKTFDKR